MISFLARAGRTRRRNDAHSGLEWLRPDDARARVLKVLGWRRVHGQGNYLGSRVPSAAGDAGGNQIDDVRESQDANGRHYGQRELDRCALTSVCPALKAVSGFEYLAIYATGVWRGYF